MASSKELFNEYRRFPPIDFAKDAHRQALLGISQAFELGVPSKLFQTAYDIWLETTRQVVSDPNYPTLFDSGDRTFSRARDLRLAGNLLSSCHRLFALDHRNPDGFHASMHILGELKDAMEDKNNFPWEKILGCDTTDCAVYTLDSPEGSRKNLLARIDYSSNKINGPMTIEELHGLRRGLFRDLMHTFQLLAIISATEDGPDTLHLAAYQNIRELYDYLDRTRKTAVQPVVSIPDSNKEELLSTLNSVKEALF